MENEQEGINLEAVNLGNDEGIILPGTEEEVEETVEQENTGSDTNSNEDLNNDSTEDIVDEEKESLKRGVNRERDRRKKAEKKNKELEARIAALEEKMQTPTKSTLDKLLGSGVDESIAKSIADAIDEKQSNSNKVEQELADMKFKLELSEKSKESNFSDIMDYEDDIKNLVDKGLSVEQAYYALLEANGKTTDSNEYQSTELTGTNTVIEKVDTGYRKAGEIVEIAFKQKMILQGGQYLLQLGCTGYEGDKLVVYHRLYDVCCIQNIGDKTTVGYFDMDSQVELL